MIMTECFLRSAGRQFPVWVAIALGGVLFFGRCANQGMPTGGIHFLLFFRNFQVFFGY